MTWRETDPPGHESAKICWEIAKWTRGKGLDIGCGVKKTYPHFIGVDNRKDALLFNQPIQPDVTVETAEDLYLFASQSMDFVFSSHLLEHIEYENVPATLGEWFRVVKMRGYVVLYLPDEDEYPKIGEPGGNVDHKWNVNYQRVIDAMNGLSWDLVDFQKRNQDQEYSLYFVFQKVGNGHHFSYRKDKPKKTAAVVRYGAYGDILQASSVYAALKKEGYHVTAFCSPPGSDVIKHDPNVDDFYYQDKDQIPNHRLTEFWDWHKKKYDKWVQLSESVEGSLLTIPGRAMHSWPPGLRHKMLDRNYVEVSHEIAGVSYELNMRFYATEEEKRWARKERAKMGKFVIAWPLAGSSVHKTWPWLDSVIAHLMLDFKDVDVVFMGGDAARILEQGWEKEPRVHLRSGKWTIRESLAFMDTVDMAIGPETGVMNAAAILPYPKIVFLSHSTDENLTRDWINTHPLSSGHTLCPGRGNNEAPACHQLHYNWNHCKKTEYGVAQCQQDITAEEAYVKIWHCITWEKERK